MPFNSAFDCSAALNRITPQAPAHGSHRPPISARLLSKMTDSPPEHEMHLEQGEDEMGDYNPESIDYDNQQSTPSDHDDHQAHSQDHPHAQEYAPDQPYEPARSPQSIRSPSAARSPLAALKPAASPSRPYDPLHPGPDPDNEPYKSPPSDSTSKQPSPAPAPTDSASVLHKSVDLQALLAGLVPAKVPSAPAPQSHDQQPPPQAPVAQAVPPVPLPPDILAQLQNMTSPPPPQSAPTFSPPQELYHPPQQPQQPPQAGPIDIQPEDLRLTPQEEALFERFIVNEREVVTTAHWDQFPLGSRMFIGNLPHDRLSKKDVFRLFYPYGRLAQISIKVGYGFVQFYEREDCEAAIGQQQGMIITGRKVHLEISKPQKEGAGRGRGRRSPPPYVRERSPPPSRGRGRGRGRGVDYEDRRPVSREYSPPREGRRFSRDDDYGRGGRRYSRSRSPPSPRSPPRPRAFDVAIVVRDDPDRYHSQPDGSNIRGYINHVEDSFQDRHLRTDVIFLNPRSSVPELTRQLVVDGFTGVVSVSRPLQERRKVSLQTFQRNPADPGAVKWNGILTPRNTRVTWAEYNEIDIPAAVDLVLNVKRGPAPLPAPQPPYAGSPYAGYAPQAPYAAASAAPAGVNPNLANIIGSLNPAALKQVFGAISQQPPPAQLGYAGYNQPAPTGAPTGPAGYGGTYGGSRPGTTQPTQQIQDIMAQLAAFSKKS